MTRISLSRLGLATLTLTGVAALLYSATGGLAAVVWTDVIQLGVVVFGVGYAVVLATTRRRERRSVAATALITNTTGQAYTQVTIAKRTSRNSIPVEKMVAPVIMKFGTP